MEEIKKVGFDLEVSDEVGQGIYSNLAIIAHSASEFIIDFASVMPAIPKSKVRSRIILTPEHAKRLYLSLQENIARYEAAFGKIEIPQRTGGFNGKIGQA